MDEHRKYLADRLLSEERPITYRLLSRALDVHVNTAKEMLFDFHKYQNATKANSVHATYLVYGSKANESQTNGDVEMSSSMPDQDVVSEQVPTKSLTLVAEENLQDLLAQFDQVASIHVYSLAPHPQRDFTLLSDVAKSLAEYKNEDVVAASKKYGTILNNHLRRRERKGAFVAPSKPAPPASSKPIKSEPAPSTTAASKPASSVPVKEEKQEPSKESTPSSAAAKAAPPSLKRGSSGGIMQAFGKAKPPKPKPEAKKEDTSMALSDDGEADEEDLPPSKKSSADAETARAARKKREEDLRQMMEEEDEEDEPEEQEDEEMKEPEEEPEPEPEPETEPEPKVEEKPQEMVSSSGDGRRRGKRKVMKKKRVLDAQGFMVTTTEEGWESFSEDDTPAPTKTETPSSTPASSAAKAKKPPPSSKASQGSIMSFFGKK